MRSLFIPVFITTVLGGPESPMALFDGSMLPMDSMTRELDLLEALFERRKNDEETDVSVGDRLVGLRILLTDKVMNEDSIALIEPLVQNCPSRSFLFRKLFVWVLNRHITGLASLLSRMEVARGSFRHQLRRPDIVMCDEFTPTWLPDYVSEFGTTNQIPWNVSFYLRPNDPVLMEAIRIFLDYCNEESRRGQIEALMARKLDPRKKFQILKTLVGYIGNYDGLVARFRVGVETDRTHLVGKIAGLENEMNRVSDIVLTLSREANKRFNELPK